MDVNEYLPMFLAESREHLQELNLAVVRIEETPDDAETLDAIFRIAHSLKGMSATMGFERIAALTHAMEDVFELLRHRRGGLDRAAIDVLLECLDALGETFEAIDREAVEKLEEGPLVDRLQALVRSGEAAESERAEGDDESDEEDEMLEADGRRVLHITAQLSSDVLMPPVRAFQIIQAAGEHGEVVRSVPAEDAVEGFGGRVVEVWLATDHEEQIVGRSVAGIPDVAGATIGEKSSKDRPAAPAANESPVSEEPAQAAPGGAHGRKAATSTVRVDAERLDQLMHLMGELVVHRTHVESLAGGLDVHVPGLQQSLQDLARSSQALQAMVMQVRMIPVEAVFLRFPRLVRDISQKLGKKVDFTLSGAETELDRTVVDALGDPLVHLVRNALDHGLEPPEEREAGGKPAAGVLEISARHAGGNVLISVRDDGRGIDPERVARKAVDRGLIPAEAAASIDMRGAIELLFTPGFSTAEQTSDLSGRGVGMDAVRTTIRELGGEVVLHAEVGRGTTAEIRLPLTLAILAALLVDAGGLPFAIQLDRVERTLSLNDSIVRTVAGKRMLMLRDGVLPLLDLAESLGHPSEGMPSHAVIVRGADRRIALGVAELVGQRELVTRPLPAEMRDRALSGGAVLANGEIALIVDCDALAGSAGPADSAPLPTAA